MSVYSWQKINQPTAVQSQVISLAFSFGQIDDDLL